MKKLQSLKPELAHKLRPLLMGLRHRGFQPTVLSGWRPLAEQAHLYQQGATAQAFSLHNMQTPDGRPQAQAAEIVDARYGWTDEAQARGFWAALGEEARKYAMYWGGDAADARRHDRARVQLQPDGELGRLRLEAGL
jgi:peptidoglycan L-alanyl-D-glutamate endopeptidase CwlK